MDDGAGPITIRQAERADLAALAALHVGHALFRRYAVETQSLEHALAVALATSDRLIVAERAHDAVGFAWWSPLGAFARSPYLRLLVVAAAEAGAGIGTRLMDAVEEAAFARAGDLFLLVTRENDRARRFYAGRGFEAVGELHDYVAPGLDEVLMRKRRPAVADTTIRPPPG